MSLPAYIRYDKGLWMQAIKRCNRLSNSSDHLLRKPANYAIERNRSDLAILAAYMTSILTRAVTICTPFAFDSVGSTPLCESRSAGSTPL